jgi:SAM-dependent methyltransferase
VISIVSNDPRQAVWKDRAAEWTRLLPPSRPSAGDARAYEAALREATPERRRTECLILGATPELRSVAHRLGCGVTCADASRSMFETLRPMVDPPGPEAFLEGDWLDLPAGAAFDAVLGDGALNMVPGPRHGELLAAVARVTRPGGIVVLRVHVRTAPPFATFEEIVAWYRQARAGAPFFSTVRTPLYMWWMARRGAAHVDGAEVRAFLQSRHEAGAITDEEFRSRRAGGIPIHMPSAEEFERLAPPAFTVEAKRFGGDYGFPENHPIYVLRRTTGA